MRVSRGVCWVPTCHSPHAIFARVVLAEDFANLLGKALVGRQRLFPKALSRLWLAGPPVPVSFAHDFKSCAGSVAISRQDRDWASYRKTKRMVGAPQIDSDLR